MTTMDLRPMGQIVRLRYQLLWARTRSRSGRIALFAMACLLLAMLVSLLAAGGIGAGVVAVRAGKSEALARAVFGGLYLEALVAAVLTGFGLNTVFTDAQLRCYPLTPWERRIVRHFIGMADPFWFLVLALECGFAAGLYFLGDYNLAAASVAILLLCASNYLLARVAGLGIDRLVSRNAGSAILVAAILVVAFLPGTLVPLMESYTAYAAVLQVLEWTPPFAAAACITSHGTRMASGFGLLTAWLLGLAAALTYIEKIQPYSRSVPSAEPNRNSVFDRIGAWFGPREGPLVALWLRYYWRNNRLRAMYALSLPVTAFLTYQFGNGLGRRHLAAGNMFLVALGAIFVLPFLAMSRLAVNQFGYVEGGFARFFLLPIDPSIVLRAGNRASMLVGGSLIPAALLLWIAFGGPFDARKLTMLLASALSGLFIQHAAGLWVTLYGPRKISYNSPVGNDMSAMGNFVVTGITACALFAPQVMGKYLPGAVSPENWWVSSPAACGAALVTYVISLRSTRMRFARKREELFAVLYR